MGEIETLSEERWATSDGVRDKVDVPTKGDPTDVESVIESATDTVQTWWQDATGQSYPEDLPDTGTLAAEHPLLVRATEYLAASEHHEKKTENVKEDEREPKYVFLERRAKSKFEDWTVRHGYDGSGGDGSATSAGSAVAGRSSSLIDLSAPGGGR